MDNFLKFTNISQLAKETGISESTLYRYRQDIGLMKVRDLKRIARVLGMTDEKVGKTVNAN